MKKKATKSKAAWKHRPTIIAPHQSPLPFLNAPTTEEHNTSGTCVESIGQKRPFIDDQNSSLHIKRAHLESQVTEIKQEYDTRNLIPLLKAYRIEAWSDDILTRINEAFLAAENALSAFNISRLDKESRRLFFMKVFRILFAPSEANEQPINNHTIRPCKPLSPMESFFRGIHGFLNETNLSTFQSPFDTGPLPDPTLSFKSMRIFCVAYAEQMNVPAEKGRECGGSNVADTVQVSACAIQSIPEAAGDVQPSAQGAGPVNPLPQGAGTVQPLPQGAGAVQPHPEGSTSNSTGDSNCTVDVQADLTAHMKTDTTLENYQKLLNAWHSSRHCVKELEQQLVDMAVDKATWETKFNVLNQQFAALKESWQDKDEAAFRIIDNALTDVPILCQQHISRTVSEAATSSTNHHQHDMKSASIRVPRKQRNRYEEIIFWLKKENLKLSREMNHAQQFAISAANYIWELPQPYCSTGFSDWSPLPHDDADSEEDSNEAGDYVHALSSGGRRSAIEEHPILLNSFEEDKHHSDRPSASNSSAGVDHDQSSRKEPLNPVRSLKERLQKKRQECLGTSSSVLNLSSSSIDYTEDRVGDRDIDHITSVNNASESNTTSKFKEALNRKVAKERAKKDGRPVDLTYL